MNILLITLDQFRGDCLSSAGPPAGPDAEPGRPRRRRRAPRPPLQPGHALRPRPGLPLHGHLPDEQPGGRQRHPARRPLRQRRPRRPAGRLHADPVRLHRPEHRPPTGRRPRRPPALRLRGGPARLRGRARPPRCHVAVDRLAAGARPRRARRHRGGAGHRAEAARRAQHLGLPHRPGRRLARAARTGPWFAHLSYLRPHPPYAAAGTWADRYDPGRRRPADPRRAPPPPARDRPDHPRSRPPRPTRRSCAGCGPSTSG